jgi:hypothetical protein
VVEDGEEAGAEQAKAVMEVEGIQQADAVLKHVAGGFGEGRARGACSIGAPNPGSKETGSLVVELRAGNELRLRDVDKETVLLDDGRGGEEADDVMRRGSLAQDERDVIEERPNESSSRQVSVSTGEILVVRES